jgi:hypothetical protein
MPLVQDDHVIQHLTTNTANQTFHIRILPRRAGCDPHLFDAYIADTLPKSCAVRAVAIVQEIPGCLVPRQRLDHLLGRPRRRWVLGDVHVHDTPSRMGEDHQHEEHAECDGRHGEEIEGDQVLYVVLEERLPCR